MVLVVVVVMVMVVMVVVVMVMVVVARLPRVGSKALSSCRRIRAP